MSAFYIIYIFPILCYIFLILCYIFSSESHTRIEESDSSISGQFMISFSDTSSEDITMLRLIFL